MVPAPGLLNSGAALLTAYGMNAPVLGLIGQIPKDAIGRNLGHLHEIRDQVGIIKRLVDHYAHIGGPAEAARLARAEHQVWAIVSDRLRDRLHGPGRRAVTEATLHEVAEHRLDPYTAADRLLGSLGWRD